MQFFIINYNRAEQMPRISFSNRNLDQQTSGSCCAVYLCLIRAKQQIEKKNKANEKTASKTKLQASLTLAAFL